MQKCIGDYDIFQQKEILTIEKSTLEKIRKYFYKLQDFFGNSKDYDNEEGNWELLLMTIKIKDLINLSEREAEWIVINVM